ncbi:hypothetical protein EFT43_07675 [Leuconostoc falkenbergense]|uniref:hypothetical protein n=1 Tax=Leuconostoc falkenbergense TaxID=2766470 RepID=UPI0021AAEA31|nr:hypothetical protein [Leuconostoc falkenbergense]MCT4404775.1 hypothetical protein [Leuconostoc falkenbergense]
MTETVVHVTTLEQWKSVLDVWFKHGHRWLSGKTGYYEIYFTQDNSRYLDLDRGLITRCYSGSNQTPTHFIEYSDFMAQQKEDNKMATYYVTQEQLDLIESAKGLNYPLTGITAPENLQKEFDKTHFDNEKEILRYLGGDETIEFKVKEQLYRLWRVDNVGDRVYMNFTSSGNPDWTMNKDVAFTAPLEEIKKWKTPAWDIEKAD